MDDFVTFSEAGKAEDDEDAGNFVDDVDEGEEYGLSSNKPPATITKNADCDWYVPSYVSLCVVMLRDWESTLSVTTITPSVLSYVCVCFSPFSFSTPHLSPCLSDILILSIHSFTVLSFSLPCAAYYPRCTFPSFLLIFVMPITSNSTDLPALIPISYFSTTLHHPPLLPPTLPDPTPTTALYQSGSHGSYGGRPVVWNQLTQRASSLSSKRPVQKHI